MYVSGMLGNQFGNHLSNSILNSVDNAASLYNDATSVRNIRKTTYETKRAIASTEFVAWIFHNIFPDPAHPPKEIFLCPQGIMIAPFDQNTASYHPTGVVVYEANQPLSYQYAAALGMLIQDMYPNVYLFPLMSVNELVPRLQSGTWYCELNLYAIRYMVPQIPAYAIDDLSSKPLDSLPIVWIDPMIKKRKLFALLSSIGMIVALSGIVFGVILNEVEVDSFITSLLKFYSPFSCLLGFSGGVFGAVMGILATVRGSRISILTGVISGVLAILNLFALMLINLF